MSIQSEITRISNNVQNTIDVIEQTGVSVPAGANSDNLPSLAQALANEKQDKLTGIEGQFVGFNSSGAAVAVSAPTPVYRTITLTASAWSNNAQTVTVQGVKTSGQSVRISPATKTDADNWVAAGVWCSEPTTANQLVFTCDTAPTENININVELQEVQS